MGFLLNQLYQDNTAVDRIVVVSKWIVCGTTQYIQYLAINPQTVVCHCVCGGGGEGLIWDVTKKSRCMN